MRASPRPLPRSPCSRTTCHERRRILRGVEAGLAAPALRAAAERFARNTLRKNAQTGRTYLSVYQRFASHVGELTGVPSPPPAPFTADAVASYLDRLEARAARKATVRKEPGRVGRRPSLAQ